MQKVYIVRFQSENRGACGQQTQVKADTRADARAKVLRLHSGHKIKIISVEER